MRLKKALAVVLAIAMVFGVVSLASAAVTVGGFADAAESKHGKQLAYLQAVGIAKGDEKGNFNPDALLTRQEFATFVARLAKQQAAADFLRSTPSRYIDDATIADWARGEVNIADANGWVKGRDDGRFHPNSNLTYAEAVTVLVRLLGYEPAVKGAWPDGHVIEAINRGITAGITLTDKNKNTPISREDMGRMLYNSMFINRMEHDVADRYVVVANSALYNNESFRGVVSAVSGTSITVGGTARDFADDVTVIGFSTSAMNSLLGQTVRVHVNSAGKVTVVMLEGDVKLGGIQVFEKFDTENTRETNWQTVHYIVFKDGSKIKYSPDNTTYSINGTGALKYGAAANEPGRIDELTLSAGDWMVVTESDGLATHVDITSFKGRFLLTADGKARTKATEEDRITVNGGLGTVSVTDATINLNGEMASVTDLKTDDVVYVAPRLVWDAAAGKIAEAPQSNGLDQVYHVEAVRKVVEGSFVSRRTVHSTTTTNYVTIKLADGTNEEYVYDAGPVPGYVAGAKVKFILDAENEVVKDLSGQSAMGDNAYKVLAGETDGVNFRIQVDNKGEKVWLTVEDSGKYNAIKNRGFGTVQYLDLTLGIVTDSTDIKWTKDGKVPAADNANVANFTAVVWNPADAGYAANRATLPKIVSVGDLLILDNGGPLVMTEENPAVYRLAWNATGNQAVVGDAVDAAKDARVLTGYNAANKLVAILIVPAN